MPATPNISVRHEDDDVLVVDKPARLICHSASNPDHPTLIAWLRNYLAASGESAPHLVNRLDRETSGLVLVAKRPDVARKLTAALGRREITKKYRAIAHGIVQGDEILCEFPIGMAKNSSVWIKRSVDFERGTRAETKIFVEKHLENFTFLRLEPKTGLTHQLRVHCAALGHPIVGDKIYGADETLYLRFIRDGISDELLDKLLLPRHALHADFLSFRHPRTGNIIEISADLADDMRDFLLQKREKAA
jgi:23S rRNA pseudouridine1911/1915/1917 synthase